MRTVTVRSTAAPIAIRSVISHVTTPAAAVQPAEALTNVVCAGSASVTTLVPSVACVPWFWTWIVYVSRSPGEPWA